MIKHLHWTAALSKELCWYQHYFKSPRHNDTKPANLNVMTGSCFQLLIIEKWFPFFFTFSVSSSRALTSWIILCISCEGMAEMTDWTQAEVTTASSSDPPFSRWMVHSLSVAKLCLERWKHVRDKGCNVSQKPLSVSVLEQEVFFFSNPLPYEYKAGTLHPMFTQTSLWKSYLTENPLSVLSRDGSDSEFVKSTAEGSCRFGERGLPWHVGRERINTCETWKRKTAFNRIRFN